MKRMKRLCLAAVCLTMAMGSFVACGKDVEDYAGVYKLYSLARETGGARVEYFVGDTLGTDWGEPIVLTEDYAVYTLTASEKKGEPNTFTATGDFFYWETTAITGEWEVDGKDKILFQTDGSGGEYTLKCTGEKLVFEDEGYTVTLKKE